MSSKPTPPLIRAIPAGPLLDSAGRLIGVNTAIISPSGSNAGRRIRGACRHGQSRRSRAYQKRQVSHSGNRHRRGQRGGGNPAGHRRCRCDARCPRLACRGGGIARHRAGRLELGDVIVSANGQPARRLSDLTDQIEAIGVGQQIELSVKRNCMDHDRPGQGRGHRPLPARLKVPADIVKDAKQDTEADRSGRQALPSASCARRSGRRGRPCVRLPTRARGRRLLPFRGRPGNGLRG